MPKIEENSAWNMASFLINENEALVLTPYRDSVGKLTIGYGTNLEDDHMTAIEEVAVCDIETGISRPVAEFLKANDMQRVYSFLSESFAFWDELSDVRQAILIDMAYNLGNQGLLQFRKMLAALRIGEYGEAANQIKDSKYFRQTGRRAKRNVYMMKFGEFLTLEQFQELK